MTMNDEAASRHVCPGIRIHAIDIVQPPGIGILPVDMDSHPAIVAVLRTIESNRFVTGVTWVDGELWHGAWEGNQHELRRIDPQTGEVLEHLEMPPGMEVSGLESDGGDQFFCGGKSEKIRAVRRPRRKSGSAPPEQDK